MDHTEPIVMRILVALGSDGQTHTYALTELNPPQAAGFEPRRFGGFLVGLSPCLSGFSSRVRILQ
jgi:hypothetical protein